MKQPLNLRPNPIETFFDRGYSEEVIDELQRALKTPKIGAFVENVCAVTAKISSGEPKNRIAAHGAAGRTGIYRNGHEVWILCVAEIDRVAWNLKARLYVGPQAMIKNRADTLSKEARAICERDPKRARLVQRENL